MAVEVQKLDVTGKAIGEIIMKSTEELDQEAQDKGLMMKGQKTANLIQDQIQEDCFNGGSSENAAK